MKVEYPSLWLAAGLYDSKITPAKMISDFCHLKKTTVEVLSSKSRERDTCQARQMIMSLLRLNFEDTMSLKDIGRIFSRDHATVIHALGTVRDLCFSDKKFKKGYNDVADKLSELSYLKEPLKR